MLTHERLTAVFLVSISCVRRQRHTSDCRASEVNKSVSPRFLFLVFFFVVTLLAQFVAPFGAYEALLGTNPIAVGIPREEGKAPVVLDMATAAFPCE